MRTAIGIGLVAMSTAACGAGGGSFRVPEASAETARLRVDLGGVLFRDARLSSDGSVSCASCHRPDHGFSDPRRFSVGIDGVPTARHTPHLFNLAGQETFFWDGRATSLEAQAKTVIEDPLEMGRSVAAVVDELAADGGYAPLFERAFPGRGVTEATLLTAVADFVRSLRADDTPFDRYEAGDRAALSEPARKGREVFFGKGLCARCHRGDDFTDGKFHNTGVPGDDLGRAALDRVGDFRVRPYPFFQAVRAFKTPGLRNVALTPPYFHDGSESTLHDVVRFYNQGGKDRASYGLSSDVRPLGLTEGEIDDLVAFLEALTSG